MPNINNTLTTRYRNAIGTFHHAHQKYTEKDNQSFLNKLAASPAASAGHTSALNILHVMMLLTLISNSWDTHEIKPRQRTQSRVSPLDMSPFIAPSPAMPHQAYGILSMLNDVIRKYDFLPTFPMASAHVITDTTSSRPSHWSHQPDVTAVKIDFSCVEQREKLSWAQILRQLGKTLESPISALAEEFQLIYRFKAQRQGCVPQHDLNTLMAITQRVDHVLTTIISFLPYANPMVITRNIGGSLLQLLADGMEGKPLDDERAEDAAEQILFLAKSTIEFSPREANGHESGEGLTLPENIYVKKNKIFSNIENKAWQLIAKDDSFWAIGNDEKHEVTYSNSEKKWSFTQSHAASVLPLHVEIIPSSNNEAKPASSEKFSQVRALIRQPENVARREERRLKSDDPVPSSSSSDPLPQKPAHPPLTPAERQKMRALVMKLAGMNKGDIRQAGGLRAIAKTNDVPLTTLRRFIKPDATLTRRGERLLRRPPRPHYPLRQGEKVEPEKAQRNIADTRPHAVNELEMIPPQKGIQRLITTHRNTAHKTTLMGEIDGVTTHLVYNLEQDVFYPATQNHEQKWQRSSDLPYIAREDQHMLSILPEQERQRTVTDEQRTAALKAMGSDLNLLTINRLLAEKPKRKPIPQKIGSIWVGPHLIPEKLVINLASNAKLAAKGRTPYVFTLYLSRQFESAYLQNMAALHRYSPGMMVIALEHSVFYQNFRQSKYHEPFAAAIDGHGGVATNFASAVDILRMSYLKQVGGLYMDVDDSLLSPLKSHMLQATPSGFVLHPPMHNDRLGMVYQYPTSVIGCHQNNPILDSILDTIYSRYEQNKDIYQFRPAITETENFNTYARRLSYVSGPAAFDSVIRQHCEEENQILEAHKLYHFPLDRITEGTLCDSFTFLYHSDVTKIYPLIQVGSANSWLHTRK